MIKATEMAKMVKQHSNEIIESASLHFDDFFIRHMKETLIVKGGYMSVDAGNFLCYLRKKQPFNTLHDAGIIKRFVSELQESGYIAEHVCPSMNPDYISVKVP
ncbi:hypothetical protein OFDDKENP_00092 [Aeromonas phage B614]|nr:hypothetical protein OFDDKENP_00092 [Aeromonas phage B614]UYD58181.1 hypothetical protein JNEOFJEA_00084 [Aeromonas phage UP87]UYD58544.1 hypothetical protein IPAKJDPM_00201 [Aeromonas phage avDM14-QBC]UYD58759.1 hypothetical protein HNNIDBEH_00166 [Aeromonas phage avDM10-HWA]UYD58937.1 hypothetical protein OFOPOMKI_00087 [Aeromonas phage avDM7-IJDJ]UYD59996.1 hypothetical protein LEHPIFIF_00240 [Aeromonas phage avDM9-HANS]